jgi:hypothetical protein
MPLRSEWQQVTVVTRSGGLYILQPNPLRPRMDGYIRVPIHPVGWCEITQLASDREYYGY